MLHLLKRHPIPVRAFFDFTLALTFALLLAMNGLGIAFGRGEIAHPVGLLISNLPLIACAALIILRGPGPLVVRWKKR